MAQQVSGYLALGFTHTEQTVSARLVPVFHCQAVSDSFFNADKLFAEGKRAGHKKR